MQNCGIVGVRNSAVQHRVVALLAIGIPRSVWELDIDGMDRKQSPQRVPMTSAQDFRAEVQEMERSGAASTPAGQARLREILKMLGVNLNPAEGEDIDRLLVRTEPFSDEEEWENTPPCFRHMLPSEVIRKFETE